MDITKIEGRTRIIFNDHYYEWYQKSQPNFLDILNKVSSECGSNSVVKFENTDNTEIYTTHIHGVEIKIKKKSNTLGTKIMTFMKGSHKDKNRIAQSNWSQYPKIDDLYIPYFKLFLKELRGVWYEQYNYDIGRKP